MADVLAPQMSPMHSCMESSMEDNSPTHGITHLSGMTLGEFIKEPKINLIAASPSYSPNSTRSSFATNSKRSSTLSKASTTKSQLRQSNTLLVEMLQNIQTELVAHRTIMLDIQHRVSHLEHESDASVVNDEPQAALRALEGQPPSLPNIKLLAPEASNWWKACQNFARNSEPPISATEFLRTPQRFSGFDFQWGKPNTPPDSPPQVEDLPPLTPTSEEGDQIDVDTPIRHDIQVGEEIAVPSPKIEAPAIELVDDIKEHTVEIDKHKMPRAPLLQPAPVAKVIVADPEETTPGVEAEIELKLEPELVGNPHRFYKGVRSLITYKAFMKQKSTDKEHHVLIHFHKKKDLQNLEDA